jgi:hypothetical protein
MNGAFTGREAQARSDFSTAIGAFFFFFFPYHFQQGPNQPHPVFRENEFEEGQRSRPLGRAARLWPPPHPACMGHRSHLFLTISHLALGKEPQRAQICLLSVVLGRPSRCRGAQPPRPHHHMVPAQVPQLDPLPRPRPISAAG